MIKNGLSFPYKVREDGSCEMLMKDNKCKVYDSRPIYCNVYELGMAMHKNIEEFYLENITVCNRIMEEDNVEMKYRIKA